MIVSIVIGSKIVKLTLPTILSGDYVLKNSYGEIVGNVIASGDKWIFQPNASYQIFNNSSNNPSIEVSPYSQISVRNTINDKETQIYFYPVFNENHVEITPKKSILTIGKNETSDIYYNSSSLKNEHAILKHEKNSWYIEGKEGLCYVNNQLVRKKTLNHGDIVFIYGLKIVCISDFILMTNLVKNNEVVLKKDSFENHNLIVQEIKENAFNLEGEFEVFDANNQFLRSPRFKTSIKKTKINIAPPPQQSTSQLPPSILTIGPRLTMILSSCMSMFTTLTAVISGTATMSSVLPSLILSVVMMVSSFLWPALSRRYTKSQSKKRELIRVRSYRKYLEKKEMEIDGIIAEQKQTIIENNVSLESCQQIIYQRKRNLWEKTINDDDFLTVRIGTGQVGPDIEIGYREEEFTMQDDFLKKELEDLIKKYNYMEETPLNMSFIENRITAIIGNRSLLNNFFESLMLQIMTFHMFSELKVFIFTDESKSEDWDYLKFLPHCWDNQHETRFIASTMEERKQLASYIYHIISDRKSAIYGENGQKSSSTGDKPYQQFREYYLVITDSIESTRNLDGIKELLELQDNLGFSLIIKHNRIANLPSQCSTFLNIDADVSGLFKNDLRAENQKVFNADFNTNINVESCAEQLANIYVEIPKGKHELPKSIGFLEMYGIGNVNQFNSLDRWKNNDPFYSLSVPVGIDQNGELFYMDIHEKAYGPHGLVAGTTGSGKSEWIITYILSLCVNFSPLEVQFVLIDYKGGGLAGSFVNQETGMRLPHLVGTITNLDKSEIRRSLLSLEAESKRRQRMFNEAREKLNDSSMNIYKYQQYYRKGMLDEPLSHLFIISDEFAELKAQEPEFLSQLVSIARIGRSLGIHLILATQKPAGVVDEQMWSNSRFKVCLRVAETADSNDMIKCPDAAFLKQTGAFYLQVGMNEFFGLGQSAYAGDKYRPTSIVKKKIETGLEVIDRLGGIVSNVDHIEEQNENSDVHGEELLNIILYVSQLASSQKMVARRLWLDSMPEIIYSDNLKKKYGFTREPYHICPIIGEYDNPYLQNQSLFRLDLNKGNVYLVGTLGSGKEKFIQSMVYSISTNYTVDEVNIYIADFGAEVMAMFEGIPHIGGIVLQNEVEKLNNLFRFIKKEYRKRRNEYREYGGNYDSYIKYSGKKDPIILVVINYLEVLKEQYGDLYEVIKTLFAATSKYGIMFVVTAAENNAVNGKSINYFPEIISLKQGDDNYSSILGSGAKGINIKDYKGRGLTEIDDLIYEFQTSSICDDSQLQVALKSVKEQLNKFYKTKAVPIPMIPKTLSIDTIDKTKININKVCVGYRKETIEPYYFDLQANFGTLILAPKKAQLLEYCKVFYRELETIANDDTRIYLFDSEDILKSERYVNMKYVNSDEVINTFDNLTIYINGEIEKYNNMEDKSKYKAPRRSLIVFHNASQIFLKLGKKSQEFDRIVEKSRELELFDFVMCDVYSDYKEIGRDKSQQKINMDSNGVLIGSVYESQAYIDINTRDIKVRENLPDNQGYIVDKGKGYLAQILEHTLKDEEEEDEI